VSSRDFFDRACSAIVQAPVSDRQAGPSFAPIEEIQAAVRAAEAAIANGKGLEPFRHPTVVKMHPTTVLSASRFVSLNAKGGDEDFFSDDLDNYFESFSGFSTPVAFLIGKEDEYAKDIDKERLLEIFQRYQPTVSRSAHSCVLEGADHCITNEKAQQKAVDIIRQFALGILGQNLDW